MSTTLYAGELVVVVDPHRGARLTSLQICDREILVTHADSPLDWGLYPMVPFAGRIRDARFAFDNHTYQLARNHGAHAIHGTVFDASWTLDEVTDSSVVLSTSLDPLWPFEGTVTHTVDVTDKRVRLTLSVLAHQNMPIQLGWHPWFSHPDSVDTNFASMLRRDHDGITTDERVEPTEPPVDDCFFEPNAWPQIHTQGSVLEIASDCPYWVRYDAPQGHVCVEPQSGPPNGINTKPLILESGKQFSRWMEIRILDTQ